MLREASQDDVSPAVLVNLAIWAAYFGDTALALPLLEKAVKGSPLLMQFAWLPVFDEIRQLPAFRELLIDIGLVDYRRQTVWPDVCRPAGGSDFACS